MSDRDPLDQLSSFRVEADEHTRARDLEAIAARLERTAPGPVGRRRRWTLGVVVALTLAGPAAAIAANDALPGDPLYPIKLAAEPIVRLFDRDVVAEHRIEEVAGLVDRATDDVVIQERIDVARDALAETDAPSLERELDRIVDRWTTDRAPAIDQPTDRPSPTTEPLRDAPSDRRDRPIDTPESTTTTVDRPAATEPAAPDPTTTTVHRDNDQRPPADDRPRDTP